MKIKKTKTGYRFDVTINKRRRRIVFVASNKKTAFELFQKWERELLLGVDSSKCPTISEATSDYLAVKTPNKKPDSQYVDRKSLGLLINLCGGHHMVSQINEKAIAQLIAYCKEELSWQVSTINRNLNSIRNFLNWCYEQSWINKPIKVTKVKGYSRESRPLNNEELLRLFNLADECLRLQVTLALTFGLRRAEIANLAWNAIDFNSGRVQIGGINGFQTKSGESRVVYLTKSTSALLKLWRSGQSVACHWVFPSTKLDGPITCDSISRHWKRTCDRAGLKDIRFHDLRATAATNFANHGYGDACIASLLGHKTQAMARKYSNNVNEVLRRKAFEKNDEHLSNTLVSDSSNNASHGFSWHDLGTLNPSSEIPLA